MALFQDGIQRLVRHEKPGVRLLPLEFHQTVKIRVCRFQKLQINICILPVIKRILRQYHRILGLHPAHQRQRFFVEQIVCRPCGSLRLIFQDIVCDPVLYAQAVIVIFFQGFIHIFRRSPDRIRIRRETARQRAVFRDPEVLRFF